MKPGHRALDPLLVDDVGVVDAGLGPRRRLDVVDLHDQGRTGEHRGVGGRQAGERVHGRRGRGGASSSWWWAVVVVVVVVGGAASSDDVRLTAVTAQPASRTTASDAGDRSCREVWRGRRPGAPSPRSGSVHRSRAREWRGRRADANHHPGRFAVHTGGCACSWPSSRRPTRPGGRRALRPARRAGRAMDARADQWHVTLRFLGEVDDPDAVAAALDGAALAPATATLGPRRDGPRARRCWWCRSRASTQLAASVVAATSAHRAAARGSGVPRPPHARPGPAGRLGAGPASGWPRRRWRRRSRWTRCGSCAAASGRAVPATTTCFVRRLDADRQRSLNEQAFETTVVSFPQRRSVRRKVSHPVLKVGTFSRSGARRPPSIAPAGLRV